jgi:hypothetical protein
MQRFHFYWCVTLFNVHKITIETGLSYQLTSTTNATIALKSAPMSMMKGRPESGTNACHKVGRRSCEH